MLTTKHSLRHDATPAPRVCSYESVAGVVGMHSRVAFDVQNVRGEIPE